MSTPRKDDDPKAAFDAEEPVQYESRKKRKRQDEDDGSLVEDVAENVVEGVLDGCLLRPLIWLGTLPFRSIWRIVQAIFD